MTDSTKPQPAEVTREQQLDEFEAMYDASIASQAASDVTVTVEHRVIAVVVQTGAIELTEAGVEWVRFGTMPDGPRGPGLNRAFNMLESIARAIARAEARGQRSRAVEPIEAYNLGRASRDAEVERLQARLHQHEGRYDTSGLLRDDAPTVTDEQLAADALRLRDALQTAVLPLGRSRAEFVAMLDRIAALLAHRQRSNDGNR